MVNRPSLARAREIYTKVIRNAVAYGAAAYHSPAVGGKPKGIARSLTTVQSKCLRVVAGAYRATPVRSLETETYVPPIDIYLNKRLADFEARLEASGKAQLLRSVCARLRAQLRRRRGRPRKQRTPSIEDGEGKARWKRGWQRDGGSDEAMLRDWKARWEADLAAARVRRPDRRLEPADTSPDLTASALAKHKGLRKHESSMLTQIRTGKIGLKAFLHQRRVPGILTPRCSCEEADETPQHLFVDCPETARARRELPELRTPRDFIDQVRNPRTAGALARWMLRLGRLRQFELAESLRRGDNIEAWVRGRLASG